MDSEFMNVAGNASARIQDQDEFEKRIRRHQALEAAIAVRKETEGVGDLIANAERMEKYLAGDTVQ